MSKGKGSGITAPLGLSDELADIVGAKKGEKLSRPEVIKRLWAYLKEHNLQDPENRQYFKPDKKMEPIFGKEKIKAFGMSKYLKEHFIKA
uniref:SWIB domain-containing protein n=1 Tax=Pseudodiaptomus poplesia TaxID=213370 RepID=A0A1S6GLB1_9MAXI|nr:SWIB domain-containing protein [Pseudodiaptomus poplesia]